MSERTTTSCREAIEQLWAYIDGELPADERQRVHDHLGVCARCYPHHDFQKAFREFLARQSLAQVPAGLRRRVFLRLLAEEARESAGA